MHGQYYCRKISKRKNKKKNIIDPNVQKIYSWGTKKIIEEGDKNALNHYFMANRKQGLFPRKYYYHEEGPEAFDISSSEEDEWINGSKYKKFIMTQKGLSILPVVFKLLHTTVYERPMLLLYRCCQNKTLYLHFCRFSVFDLI